MEEIRLGFSLIICYMANKKILPQQRLNLNNKLLIIVIIALKILQTEKYHSNSNIQNALPSRLFYQGF